MAIKLVISDIDGTLVQHRPYSNDLARADELIPQTAVEAIAQLHSRSIMVAGITGRTYEQSREILTRLGIEGPCVFSGGAVIRNLPSGEVLYEATLPDEAVNEVKNILTHYLADGRSIELNPSSLDPTKYNSIWAKLRKNDADKIERALAKVPNIYFVMNDGHGHAAEFGVAVLCGGTDKGDGARKLLSLSNIRAHEVVCIGDGANDIPMFNECGFAIAMGNSADVVKEAANYVVAPVESDGFAEAVNIVMSKAS